MRKTWLALALAGMMCIAPCLGMAESAPSFDAEPVQPLLNAVASAALGSDDAATHLSEDEPLSGALVARLRTALISAGMDAEALASLVAMPLDGAGNEAGSAVMPLTIQVLFADVSEEGDAVMILGSARAQDEGDNPLSQRVAIELHKDEASPVGWKLYRFTADDLMLIEALTDSYFAGTMIEYINAGCGFSIQYPSAFGEDMIVESENGIQAELSDGSASFSVMRIANEDGLSLPELLAREEANGALTWVDEGSGAGRSMVTDEEGITHEAIFLIGDGVIYQAELNYARDVAETYERYAEYMMNSFSADELGLG